LGCTGALLNSRPTASQFSSWSNDSLTALRGVSPAATTSITCPTRADRLRLAGQLYGKRTQLEPPRRELQRRAKDDGLLDEGGYKAIRARRSLEEEVPLLIGERTKGRVRSVSGTQYDEGIHQGSLVRLADEGPLQPRLVGTLGSEDSSKGKDEEEK